MRCMPCLATCKVSLHALPMQDAEWAPVSEAEHCATGVAIGSGLSCTSELAEAGMHVTQGAIRKCAGFCRPCMQGSTPASVHHLVPKPSLQLVVTSPTVKALSGAVKADQRHHREECSPNQQAQCMGLA